MDEAPFWRRKTLDEMTPGEWEKLCDGCGKCCLVKLIDDLTDDLHYTEVACRLLDCESCRCKDYPNRKALVPDCVVLSPAVVRDIHWMPSTCAYRLVHEGKDLPFWHHLVCGDPAMVHKAGISVGGRVVSEDQVPEERLVDYIVDWPA
jgi:uncharacterized cysteine cluster protein YcgN (CxxCxxCC family)